MSQLEFQHAVVFANGDADAQTLARLPDTTHSLIVAVDGGLRHCLALGLTPHWLVGDLDSLPDTVPDPAPGPAQATLEKSGEPTSQLSPMTLVERFPVEKDATDLELALLKLAQHNVTSVTLAGIDGGRLDHTLTNILLIGCRAWPYKMSVVMQGGYGVVVDGQHPFEGIDIVEQTVSLIALTPDVQGVTTDGLYYPLHDAQLRPGSTLGMSNRVNAAVCSVRVAEGRLLVLVNTL